MTTSPPDKPKRPRWLPLAISGAVIALLIFCGLFALGGAGAWFFSSRSTAQSAGETSASLDRPEIPAEQAVELEASPTPVRPDERARSLEPGEALLTGLRGLIAIQPPNGEWQAITAETVLSAGTRLYTGELSAATVIFGDGSQALIGADTDLTLEEIQAGASGVPRRISLIQRSGETQHRVVPMSGGESGYIVNTPQASGAALGTSFRVLITPEDTSFFSVLAGQITVTAAAATVTVPAGEMTAVAAGEPPAEPSFYIFGEGLVSQTGETWIIDGQEFLVHTGTRIVGGPEIGDWVLVEGRLLDDGSRIADLIVLLSRSPLNRFTLAGPVQAIGEAQWTVAGQIVVVNADTQIDSDLVVGDTARVEGIVQGDGLLVAESITRIDAEAGLPFEFTGVIASIEPESWLISGLAITIAADTEVEPGLEVGDVVHVEGHILPDGTWLAARITRALEDERAFTLTGAIDSIDPWVVAGLEFEVRDWTVFEDGLQVGDLVRVSGQVMEDGVWVASRIERLEDSELRIVVIGIVNSLDPWVVSGITLVVNDNTQIEGDIAVGMLVRVEIELQNDGSWLALIIAPVEWNDWSVGCFDLTGTVISFTNGQLQLDGWPLLTIDENVTIEGEGELAPGTVVQIQLCFDDEDHLIVIIIILVSPDLEPTPFPTEPPEADGDKVTICHKPNGNNPHTITVSRSALPAHLGHGDHIGACSGGGKPKKNK